MAAKKQKGGKAKKVSLRLTPEQLRKLAEVFGPEFAKRARDITLEQVEGFIRSEFRVN